MKHRAHPRIGAAILIAVILTGCTATANDTGGSALPTATPATTATASTATTPPEPSTTNTPTPEPTPTALTREEQVFAEAVASMTEYTNLAVEIENNGGEGWEALKPWWGNEQMLAGGTAYFEEILLGNVSTIGSTTFRDAVPIAIEPDAYGPGLDGVEMTYCLDSSHSERRDVDGNPFPVSGKSMNVEVTMRRTQPGDHWTIDWMTTALDPPC